MVTTNKPHFAASKNDVLEGDIIIEAGNQVAWNVNPPRVLNSQLLKPTDEARLGLYSEDREKARIKSTPVKVTRELKRTLMK